MALHSNAFSNRDQGVLCIVKLQKMSAEATRYRASSLLAPALVLVSSHMPYVTCHGVHAFAAAKCVSVCRPQSCETLLSSKLSLLTHILLSQLDLSKAAHPLGNDLGGVTAELKVAPHSNTCHVAHLACDCVTLCVYLLRGSASSPPSLLRTFAVGLRRTRRDWKLVFAVPFCKRSQARLCH